MATVANKKHIYDACGLCPSIWRTLNPVFHQIQLLLTSCLDAYILRCGNFCANDDDNNNDNDVTNNLLPLVHVRWVINGQIVSVKHTGGMEWSM